MIKPLKRFYKIAPNGKLELLGKDGLEHLLISLFVMIACPSLVGVIYGLKWALVAAIITFIVLRFVWFFIEQFQERIMYKKSWNALLKKHTRVKNFWKFWQWSSARKVDMTHPFYGDSVALAVIVFIYICITKTPVGVVAFL